MELIEGYGFFGLFPYTPRIAALRQLPADDKLKQATNFIYNFKKHGRNADQVKILIESAAGQLGCSAIVVIPGSTPVENNLQKLFGVTIQRTAAVKSRKYNHTKKLPDDYRESYQVAWGEVSGSKVLLVDDVCTSGATLRHFCSVFEDKGFETVGLAVGLHYRKIGEPAKPDAELESEWWVAGADPETVSNLKSFEYLLTVCEIK